MGAGRGGKIKNQYIIDLHVHANAMRVHVVVTLSTELQGMKSHGGLTYSGAGCAD